ncbi:MAG: tRNA lysidine(34) synthetase TilS, partial [Lachnospiraceae bacterium]|nr:tRNA lysidine(34) synthetase TilS [Lachnospiraceae bacterium]
MEQKKQIEGKVYRYCRVNEMFARRDHVLVALSGGGDSVCLLHMLLSLRDVLGIRISAAHIHHGLRESANRDAEFAKELCEAAGIDFYTERVDVRNKAESEGKGIEEAARELRYEQLWRIAEAAGADKLAVAHHMEDQAETLLFSLCRGSGIRGMAGMHPVSGRLVRPLLCLKKEEILLFLSQSGLSYMTDETNADMAYTRNRIRTQILPLMCEEVNAGAVSHMARFGETMAQLGEYLSGQIGQALAECQLEREELSGAGMVLSIPKLLSYPDFLQTEIVHLCIARMAGQRKDIGAVHTAAVLGLCEGISGKQVMLPYQIRARRDYDRLCF